MSPGIIAVRRKSENTQITFEAIILPNDQTFLRNFKCLLSLREMEITEDLPTMFSVYVFQKLLIFHEVKKNKKLQFKSLNFPPLF